MAAAIAPKRLIDALGPWSASTGPLAQRLAGALRGALARGDIPPGTRLPAERTLAVALSLSRGTVVAAYEALRQDGLLESRQGSGTYAPASAAPPTPAAIDRSAPLRGNVVTRGILEGAAGTIPLLGAHVLGAPGLSAELCGAALEDLGPLLRGPGYLPLGLPALREALARALCDGGLPTQPEQLLVTSGAQQAIALCARLFLRPGDGAALESPTYLTAIDILRSQGARLLSVPHGALTEADDRAGLDLVALQQALGKGPRLCYLTPTFHNPTGAVLPAAARAEVAVLAARTGVPLIEDLALSELWFHEPPPPPIASFLPPGREATILTIGSLSKVAWAGLRVGFVRAAPEIILRLGRLKVIDDLGSSLLSQAVAVRLLAQAAVLWPARRREVAACLERLVGGLRAHLPDWRFRPPRGGLSLWVELPAGDASEFAQVALRHGVSLVPGALAAPEGGFAAHLRLPIVVEDALLDEALRRLSQAWRTYAPGAARQRAVTEVLV